MGAIAGGPILHCIIYVFWRIDFAIYKNYQLKIQKLSRFLLWRGHIQVRFTPLRR